MPVPIDSIRPHDRNPRKIGKNQFALLVKSIKRDPEFMQLRPIVVDDDGVILGGNMRWRACKDIGLKELPDEWVVKASHLTPEQRRRFVVVDNAPDGMAGEWDFDILGADWDLPDLGEIGFEMPEAQQWEDPDDTGGNDKDNGMARVTIVVEEMNLNQFKRSIAEICERFNARMA